MLEMSIVDKYIMCGNLLLCFLNLIILHLEYSDMFEWMCVTLEYAARLQFSVLFSDTLTEELY